MLPEISLSRPGCKPVKPHCEAAIRGPRCRQGRTSETKNWPDKREGRLAASSADITIGRQTDRQTDRQTGRQAGRQAGR